LWEDLRSFGVLFLNFKKKRFVLDNKDRDRKYAVSSKDTYLHITMIAEYYIQELYYMVDL